MKYVVEGRGYKYMSRKNCKGEDWMVHEFGRNVDGLKVNKLKGKV
jgi:hypothetical protein